MNKKIKAIDEMLISIPKHCSSDVREFIENIDYYIGNELSVLDDNRSARGVFFAGRETERA